MPPLPTASDRRAFAHALRAVSPLAQDELASVERHARVERLAAGETFLAAGDRAVDCGVVALGVMREYFPLADGREVTRSFAGPGEGVGSLSDLLSGAPARSAATAVTDVRLVLVPWVVLRDLAMRVPAWTQFLARTTERLYLAKAEREYQLLALDAAARYRAFCARYAQLEAAIPLRHVASYVGVTPEHLSRLRRRMARAAGE